MSIQDAERELKKINPYYNGKIYMLYSKKGEKIYIGSTTKSLMVRMRGHIYDFGRKTQISSTVLFKEYGIDNVKIKLLEDYPCLSRRELEDREFKHMKERVNLVNVIKCREDYAVILHGSAERFHNKIIQQLRSFVNRKKKHRYNGTLDEQIADILAEKSYNLDSLIE